MAHVHHSIHSSSYTEIKKKDVHKNTHARQQEIWLAKFKVLKFCEVLLVVVVLLQHDNETTANARNQQRENERDRVCVCAREQTKNKLNSR